MVIRCALVAMFLLPLVLSSPLAVTACAQDSEIVGAKAGLSFSDDDGTDADKLKFKFTGFADRQPVVADPTCPAPDTTVRLSDDDQAVEFTLPCSGWEASGSGYKFSDAAAASGIAGIRLQPGKLLVKTKGNAYGALALAGPSTFTQAEVAVGTWRSCGRFEEPSAETTSNDASRVKWKGTSVACEPFEFTCATLPPAMSGSCDVTVGGVGLLLRGDVLSAGAIHRGGEVHVDASGTIDCMGCDCSAVAIGSTIVSCPQASISPAFINPHDHLAFSHNDPFTDTGERYEQRHDWRLGQRGHTSIPTTGGATTEQLRWGELRGVLGGATSVVGSGGSAGLLRNLDDDANQEGLGQMPVFVRTFPLGDSGGLQLETGCGYPAVTTAASIIDDYAFNAHVGEGVDATARNEFTCLRATGGGGQDLTEPQSAFVHGSSLATDDFATMARERAKLVWSPRSNIALYGETVRVTTAVRTGTIFALGTDWTPTGSMNMLRELRCARDFSEQFLDGFFPDHALWRMATFGAAHASAVDDVLGTLADGYEGDITIFDASVNDGFSAAVNAEVSDVVLVLRGGLPLYGDQAVVAAIPSSGSCDPLDVCGRSKRVCLLGQIGETLGQLEAANPGAYPLFACGTPPTEPTCTPSRTVAVSGSSTYDGTATMADGDGDGVLDTADDCPNVFDPIRPVDGGVQPDTDGDGIGDACDRCPLSRKC